MNSIIQQQKLNLKYRYTNSHIGSGDDLLLRCNEANMSMYLDRMIQNQQPVIQEDAITTQNMFSEKNYL